MNVGSATMPFPVRLKNPIRIDPVLLGITLTLLLGGLVVLASASISTADNSAGDPFFYVGRQAVAALLGAPPGSFACLYLCTSGVVPAR